MLIGLSERSIFTEKDFLDIDGELSLSPSALLHRFQDIARRHAASAGLGFDDMLARGLIWVMTGIRCRVEGELTPGREYTVETYPLPNGSRMFQRDFYVKDGGAVLVRATSQWCVLNYLTRELAQAELGFPGEYTTETAFPDKLRRVRPPKDMARAASHVVEKSDLDGNDHTNNCRYVELALEAMPTRPVRELTASFIRETRLNDAIEISVSGDGRFSGESVNGEAVFAMEIHA